LVDGGRMGFAGDRVVTSSKESREVVEKELRRHFPPEFLNRLDDVVVFAPLEPESMLEVICILLRETAENLESRRVVVQYEPEVAGWLLGKVADEPTAGARPLRKLIRGWIEDPIADVLIRHGGNAPLRLVASVGKDRPVVAVRELHEVADQSEERL